MRLIELGDIDSTSSEAMRRAAAGERGPLWITAIRQTQGRGRSGRGWQTPPGNLAATLLMAPGCPARALHQLSLLTGVAVVDALAPLVPPGLPAQAGLRLKWPNDVLLGAAKLGGILVETSSFGGETVAAIGIGLNVAHAPDVAGRDVACLRDAGIGTSARDLLPALDSSLGQWLNRWRGGEGFATVRRAWLDRTGAIGEPMTVHAAGSRTIGAFDGIDADGALLLRGADGTVRTFTVGDVSLRSQST